MIRIQSPIIVPIFSQWPATLLLIAEGESIDENHYGENWNFALQMK